MKLLKRIWDHLEDYICSVLLIVALAALVINVFGRIFLGKSNSYSEELARYLYVWFVFLGGSLTAREGAHLRVDAVLNLYPRRLRVYINDFAEYIWLAFNVFVIVIGFKYFGRMYTVGSLSAALKIPMSLVYLALPVGYTLMTVRVIIWKINKYRHWDEEKAKYADPNRAIAEDAIKEADV